MTQTTDTAGTQASNGAQPPEHDKQTNPASDEGSWRGRFEAAEAKAKELEAQLGNAKWAQEKLLEIQNKPKDEPFFSDDDKSELEALYGEEGAKRYVKDFDRQLERVMARLPQSASAADTNKAIKEASDKASQAANTAANAEFLGAFDTETRGRIINPNSELMKFAATLKTGYGRTAAKDIQGIIDGKDKSDEAMAYIEDVKAKFAQNKHSPQLATGGNPASKQLGSKTLPAQGKPTESISQFKDVT